MFYRAFLVALTLVVAQFFNVSLADTVAWNGPTDNIVIGVAQDDIAHVEFPEPIINITVENQDYIDVLVVEGYQNRAFRMRSMLPKMATRMFMTGESGRTYIVIATTDVPYRAFVQVVDGTKIDEVARNVAKQFDATDMVRAMARDVDVPGVLRETYVIPAWFRGSGTVFDLSEVWQSSYYTGLVVNVRNELDQPNEVTIPAITIPQTDEWGILRYAAMENMRLNARGKPNSQGTLFLVFKR